MIVSVSAVINSIEVISPNGGEFWSGTQEITWTTDGGDGEFVLIKLYNGQDINIKVVLHDSSPYLWDTTQYSDGETYQIFVADDTHGEINDFSDHPFTIDNTDPFVDIDSVDSPTNVNTQTITGTFTEVNLANITVNDVLADINGNTYSAEINLVEEENDVTVIATDKAGNQVIDDSQTITLDTTEPTVGIAGATADLLVGTGVEASVTCSDEGGTGCDTESYQLYISTTYIHSCPSDIGDYISSPQDIIEHSWVCAYAEDNVGNPDFSDEPVEFEVFATIQDAIDVAEEGETILVSAGTYEEDLKIIASKTGLELVGENKATTIIKGVANVHKDDWPLAVPNIEILADGVKIHGFTIEGPNYVPHYYASGIVLNGQNIEIYENDFVTTEAANTDELAHAITTYSKTAKPLADVSGLNIHNNTFAGSGAVGMEAIYINPHTGTGTITIDKNQFSGSVFIGITAESGNVDATKNEIDSDVIGKGLYGIRFMDSTYVGNYDNIVISENTVQNFQKGIRVGNGLYPDTSVFIASILSNTLTSNDVGIWGRNGNQITATYNSISGNTVGIQNDIDNIATVVDAKINYWGCSKGPEDDACDSVSDNVDYTPWAWNEAMEVDEVKPVTEIISPEPNSWQNSDFSLDVTDTDDGGSGLDKCYYRVDSKIDDSWDVTKGWTERICDSITPLITVGVDKDCRVEGENGNGRCRVHVKSEDVAGNSDETWRHFSIDWTAPVTTDLGTDTNWHVLDVTVTLNCDDTDSGCNTTYYCVDQENNCDPTTEGTSVTVSAEGENYVRFYSTDLAGNEESVQITENTVKIDTTAPEITDVTGDTVIVVGKDVEICAIITDAGSGIVSAVLYYDSKSVPMVEGNDNEYCATIPNLEEDVEYNITAIDDVGNDVTSSTYTIEVVDFMIELQEGNWYLISIPVVPDSTTIGDVLGDADVSKVYAYDPSNPNSDANGWLLSIDGVGSLEIMTAGYGYWVYANSDTVIKGNGELISEPNGMPTVPPSRNLVAGWNLIGHYGLEEKPIDEALYSLVNKMTNSPTWNAIWPSETPNMEPEQGYWLAIDGSLTVYTPNI